MMAKYGQVVRWSAALTSVVATVAVVLCASLIGAKGAYGALIGVATIGFAQAWNIETEIPEEEARKRGRRRGTSGSSPSPAPACARARADSFSTAGGIRTHTSPRDSGF